MKNQKMTPWLKHVALGVISSIALLSPRISNAQWPCDSGWSWNTVGNPGDIKAIADVGGTLYASIAVPGLALASWDGLSWTPRILNVAQGTISILATSGDGFVYLGGSFNGLYDINNNLVPAKNVARFNPSDNTITPIGNGTPRPATALAIDSFGRVYVGMDALAPVDPITSFPGMVMLFDTPSQSWVILGGGLHPDTTVINCNGGPLPPAAVPAVTALAVDGYDLYVAGLFDQCGLGNVITYQLAKWSWCAPSGCWGALAPTRWTAYSGGGGGPDITSIAVISNRLYVTGNFFPPCGATYPQGLAEFSTTGTGLLSDASDNLWNALQSDGTYDVGTGSSLCIRACTVYLTGKFQILGGADLTAPNGVHVNHVAHSVRFSRGSTTWGAMGTGLTEYGDPYGAVGYGLAADQTTDTNHVFINGSFTHAGGVSTYRVANWSYVAPDPQ